MMFNTGDLGRWNTEGELEHFGRTDDQVKVKASAASLALTFEASELT